MWLDSTTTVESLQILFSAKTVQYPHSTPSTERPQQRHRHPHTSPEPSPKATGGVPGHSAWRDQPDWCPWAEVNTAGLCSRGMPTVRTSWMQVQDLTGLGHWAWPPSAALPRDGDPSDVHSARSSDMLPPWSQAMCWREVQQLSTTGDDKGSPGHLAVGGGVGQTAGLGSGTPAAGRLGSGGCVAPTQTQKARTALPACCLHIILSAHPLPSCWPPRRVLCAVLLNPTPRDVGEGGPRERQWQRRPGRGSWLFWQQIAAQSHAQRCL